MVTLSIALSLIVHCGTLGAKSGRSDPRGFACAVLDAAKPAA
jgi:hypothetical protein